MSFQPYNGSGVLVPERLLPTGAPKWNEVPGDGKPVILHWDTFVAKYTSLANTYYNPDAAYRENKTLQRAMQLDPVVMEPLRSRQLAVSLLDWSIVPEDEDSEEQVEWCREYEKAIKRIPRFVKLKMALLEAIWFGRYAVELIWRPGGWNAKEDKPTMNVSEWIPIHGDKLRLQDRTSRLGVFVRAASGKGSSYGDEAQVQWLDEDDRKCFAFHQHEILDGDFFDPYAAGAIMGLGLRHRVWWPWFFKQNLITWLMDYANRIGTGFTVWYYQRDNDASYRKVKEAAENAQNNTQILFPRGEENKTRGEGIERVEASTGGGQFLYDLLDKYFCEQIKMMIAGQTLTSETGATGLGSNVAEQHANTKAQYQRFDSMNLDETITTDILWPMLSYPTQWAQPWKPRYKSTLQTPDPEKLMQAARQFYDMGGDIPEQHLRDTIGLPKAKAGERMLSQKQSQGQLPFMGAE